MRIRSLLLVLAGVLLGATIRAVVPAHAQDEGDPRRKAHYEARITLAANGVEKEIDFETGSNALMHGTVDVGGKKLVRFETATGGSVYVDADKILVIELDKVDTSDEKPEHPPIAPK